MQNEVEIALQLAGLLVLGLILYEAYRVKALLDDRTERFRKIEERLGKFENKLDGAVERYSYLDRFKPGKDDPA
jgi:hypothetical protein